MGNKVSVDLIQQVLSVLELKTSLVIEDEPWNDEYEAFNFQCNHRRFKSRLAKKTTKKTGYFLSMWKKNTANINQPFNEEEFPEKLVVHIIDNERIGQFIFPKHVLLAYGILSDGRNQGKIAFRVYPSWEKNLNNTARKTQKWQMQYFTDLSYHYDKTKLEKLYYN